MMYGEQGFAQAVQTTPALRGRVNPMTEPPPADGLTARLKTLHGQLDELACQGDRCRANADRVVGAEPNKMAAGEKFLQETAPPPVLEEMAVALHRLSELIHYFRVQNDRLEKALA